MNWTDICVLPKERLEAAVVWKKGLITKAKVPLPHLKNKVSWSFDKGVGLLNVWKPQIEITHHGGPVSALGQNLREKRYSGIETTWLKKINVCIEWCNWPASFSNWIQACLTQQKSHRTTYILKKYLVKQFELKFSLLGTHQSHCAACQVARGTSHYTMR